MLLIWIIAAADSGFRSESLLFRLERPFKAFVRSTAQPFRTSVKPWLPGGRDSTSMLQPGRFSSNQVARA
jgi:hypothetical protein